ncbi:MAG: hypothetical protein AAF439_12430 [Pseudomonadota bacterium]
MLRACLFAIAALFAAASSAAVAQGLAGTWSCQDGRQYTGSLASSSELRTFQMFVYPNGAVEGAGTVQIVNGAAFQYSFRGGWQVSGDSFFFNAESSLQGAQMDFQSRLLDAYSMALDWIDPATQTRLSTNCRRSG